MYCRVCGLLMCIMYKNIILSSGRAPFGHRPIVRLASLPLGVAMYLEEVLVP